MGRIRLKSDASEVPYMPVTGPLDYLSSFLLARAGHALQTAPSFARGTAQK
jgi:hypothetical protein